MSIQTVLSDIQLSTLEPLHFWFFEVPIQYIVPFLHPLKMLGDTCPKACRIINALLVLLAVFVQTLDLIRV
jgi:hypothetical protein